MFKHVFPDPSALPFWWRAALYAVLAIASVYAAITAHHALTNYDAIEAGLASVLTGSWLGGGGGGGPACLLRGSAPAARDRRRDP